MILPLHAQQLPIADVEGILNHDLHMISVWARQWLVTFNPDKSVAIHFSKTFPKSMIIQD